MRGKVHTQARKPLKRGITPAYAGKSYQEGKFIIVG